MLLCSLHSHSQINPELLLLLCRRFSLHTQIQALSTVGAAPATSVIRIRIEPLQLQLAMIP
jgi:hypothetical protein